MYGLSLRKGFSMNVKQGIHLNRPDMHNIAHELGVSTRDVLIKDGVLTVYNTSATCQEIVEDNALPLFIAMAVDISAEDISDIREVVEEPVKIEFDLDAYTDED